MKQLIYKLFADIKAKQINKRAQKKWRLMLNDVEQIKIPDNVLVSYNKLYDRLGVKPSVDFLKLVSSISGVVSHKFVPEDIQYSMIEPTINNRAFSSIYNDKNFYDRYLHMYSNLFPNVIFRSINNTLYDASYGYLIKDDVIKILKTLKVNTLYIAKPSIETGGGENVIGFKLKDDLVVFNDRSVSYDEFIIFLSDKFNGSFIVQERIIQHDYFKTFNESSLNTVRMYVYRSVKDNKVHPLHAYIRSGAKGSLVDSSTQGGNTCGVDIVTGYINNFSVTKYGKKNQHSNSKLGEITNPVPMFDEMKLLAKEIAPLFPYHHLLGFDFCVDAESNVRLLEVNNLYIGVINQQMSSGPLYGDYIDEIIEYCLKHKKNYNINFRI